MREGCLWEIKTMIATLDLQTPQQVILFKECEEKMKANHGCGEVESAVLHSASCSTAHCRRIIISVSWKLCGTLL
jgi:hypothetical protein